MLFVQKIRTLTALLSAAAMVQCDMSRAHEIQINCSSRKNDVKLQIILACFWVYHILGLHVYTDEKESFLNAKLHSFQKMQFNSVTQWENMFIFDRE